MDQAPTQQENNATPAPASSAPASNKTDVLGIISIIMAFFGLQLIGFILGLVGVKKAKEEGRPTTLSKIGWILNLIFMILTVIAVVAIVALGAAANKANDDMLDKARESAYTNDMGMNDSGSEEKATNTELVAAYDKLSDGMSKADAEKALGVESKSCSNSTFGERSYESCSYGGYDDGVSITVTYENGAISTKSKYVY